MKKMKAEHIHVSVCAVVQTDFGNYLYFGYDFRWCYCGAVQCYAGI